MGSSLTTQMESMCSGNKGTTRQRREGCQTGNDERHRSSNRRYTGDHWGDKLHKKAAKHIRISFVNVNGIGAMAKNEKSEDIRRYMVKEKVDVMGLRSFGALCWLGITNFH